MQTIAVDYPADTVSDGLCCGFFRIRTMYIRLFRHAYACLKNRDVPTCREMVFRDKEIPRRQGQHRANRVVGYS